MKAQNINAQQLSKELCNYLCPPNAPKYSSKWVALEEFSTPNVKNGRLDVIAARTSYAAQEVRGFEIKVSKQDFYNDVEEGKYTKYLNVCNTLYFVVPKNMIKKTEIPESCGLLIYNGKSAKTSFTSLIRAPRHSNPPGLNWQTYLAMLMRNETLHVEHRHRLMGRLNNFAVLRNVVRRHMKHGTMECGIDSEGEDLLVHWAARKAGEYFARDKKSHGQEINDLSKKVFEALNECGFKVDITQSYNDYQVDSLIRQIKKVQEFNKHFDDLVKSSNYVNHVLSGWGEVKNLDVFVGKE